MAEVEVVLTWRVTNKDGMRWRWNTLAQARAQLELWGQSWGGRGVITPVFTRNDQELTLEEIEMWVTAANQALAAASEVAHG